MRCSVSVFPAAARPELACARNRPASLELLEQAQLGFGNTAMLRRHVRHLTADHAVHAGVLAQNPDAAQRGLRRNVCLRSGLERRGQQTVAASTAVASSERLVAGPDGRGADRRCPCTADRRE